MRMQVAVAMQERPARNRLEIRRRANTRYSSLPAGLICGDRGNRMTPGSSHQRSRRHTCNAGRAEGFAKNFFYYVPFVFPLYLIPLVAQTHTYVVIDERKKRDRHRPALPVDCPALINKLSCIPRSSPMQEFFVPADDLFQAYADRHAGQAAAMEIHEVLGIDKIASFDGSFRL